MAWAIRYPLMVIVFLIRMVSEYRERQLRGQVVERVQADPCSFLRDVEHLGHCADQVKVPEALALGLYQVLQALGSGLGHQQDRCQVICLPFEPGLPLEALAVVIQSTQVRKAWF